MHKHTLEPAAQAFADATSQPPFLYELGPEGARKVLDDVQAAPIAKPDVDEMWVTVPADVQHIPGRVEMSASFTPCYVGSDAYIRVHVPNGPRPDGSIVVYLTNGTALVVNDEELLHLDTSKISPSACD